MKGFQKLALAAAIAAAPFAAQAELTAMDDALLSDMTGQSGITIDLNLDVQIAEIRYTDEDGSGTDIDDGGFLTLSNIVVNGDQGAANDQAIIKGVTIDVDGTDGIVIGLGQIGGQSTVSQASSAAAVGLSDYWTGVNISADLGINGTSAGSIEVKNFTNYVPNALAVEAMNKFGYDIVDVDGELTGGASPGATLNELGGGTAGTKVILSNATTGNVAAIAGGTALVTAEIAFLAGSLAADATEQDYYDQALTNVVSETDDATVNGTGSNGFADALAAGNYIDANISIKAGGEVGEGLTISAVAGFVIEELSFSDDGQKMGLHNFVMFDTEADGTITGFKIDGLTIDVVASGNLDDNWTPTNSSATAALKIAGLTTSGTIAIGDIFIGDHSTGSLGGVSIRDIDLSNTEIYVYGH